MRREEEVCDAARGSKLIFWLVSNLIGRLEAETTNEKRVFWG